VLSHETVGTVIKIVFLGTIWSAAVVIEVYCAVKLWADPPRARGSDVRGARLRIVAAVGLLLVIHTAAVLPFVCMALPAYKDDPLACFGRSWLLFFASAAGAYLWLTVPLAIFVWTGCKLDWFKPRGQPCTLPPSARLLVLFWIAIIIEAIAYWVWVYSRP
jgi:hypothetical protein